MIMTQENKELLLKDLCSRLPYGVKISVNDKVERLWEIDSDGYISTLECETLKNIHKPYLFPLSSMSDEQCEELRNLIYDHFTLDDEFNEGISFKTYGDILVWLDEKPINQCYFIFDWFNKYHFDYRGLIPIGLANDATGKNIY